MIPSPISALSGPAAVTVTGQSPPGSAANSSLSDDDRRHLRPLTALSQSDPAEADSRIIGPHVGPLARQNDKDRQHKQRHDNEADQPQDQFLLSSQAVDRLIETDPALERMIRSEMARETGKDKDAPVDQAAFRAKVIEYLKSVYADDPAFQRALKKGTIVVRQVSEDGDPELQPQRTYTIYRSGAMEGAASESAGSDHPGKDSVGRHDFIAWWPQ
ncbi:hypothetical protein GL279_08790 [Paracoccus limosus]|uniref:Uncharacterized protein n=1 Tax=Paracoccus limosus TaxID=913252 RepID=A0A844H3V6_9RHOB|nr:hypothetical protein [Paracoccus limosus]MTH34695.1 hypothetical protein [Paracoccus limosus]